MNWVCNFRTRTQSSNESFTPQQSIFSLVLQADSCDSASCVIDEVQCPDEALPCCSTERTGPATPECYFSPGAEPAATARGATPQTMRTSPEKICLPNLRIARSRETRNQFRRRSPSPRGTPPLGPLQLGPPPRLPCLPPGLQTIPATWLSAQDSPP